ncbi:MAG: EAL domain-containing protein [Alphaproteobacteria bacterium]|nr:EAL domain-containing protein [Alphaproteobacteria bacterium]
MNIKLIEVFNDLEDDLHHPLLRNQLSRCMNDSGELDIKKLLLLIDQAYEEEDKGRKISVHASQIMSEEVMEVNKELRQKTSALLDSKERYELVSRAANDIVWDYDFEKKRVIFSQRAERIFGDDWKPEVGISLKEFLFFVHPEDRLFFYREVKTHLRKFSKRIELEARIRDREGMYFWVFISGLGKFDIKNRPIRLAGSITDISERKNYEQTLYKAAFYDALTGLPNRALFIDRLQQVINREKRLGERPAALLLIDLDRFKVINDTYGHNVGDEVIQAVAERLKKFIRPNDTLSHLAGDEFALLLSEIDHADDATQIADRVLREFAAPFYIGKKKIILSASIGLSIIDHKSTHADDVMRYADLAMYSAKSEGKAKAQVFDEGRHKHMLENLEIETDLQHALSKDQFIVYYQPIIDLQTGKIEGFESLIRWCHPVKGFIPPLDFISIAEQTGLIGGIGEFVLKSGCHQQRLWAKQFKHPPSLAINVSVKQLMDDRSFDRLLGILDKAKIPLSTLKLEITESMIMHDSKQMFDKLILLKGKGVTLCIDDFGTGYSSLSYLHHFPFDVLKIDKSFVDRITFDDKTYRVVMSILNLAKDMNIKIVAEGIETIGQFDILERSGCHYGQGYLFSKPVTVDVATHFIQKEIKFPIENNFVKKTQIPVVSETKAREIVMGSG